MIADISSQQQEPEARKRKRGETREDGMRFWQKQHGSELWLTPESFDKQQEKCRQRYLKNAEKIKAKLRQKYLENPEPYKEKAKLYAEKNPEKVKLKAKQYAEENKEHRKKYIKQWYEENKEEVIAKQKEYSKKNPHVKLKAQKNYYARHPLKAFQRRVRTLIYMSLANYGRYKSMVSEAILGCSLDFFVGWIEKQFVDGMNWGNRDQWHIDHIIPMASSRDEPEAIMLNHYTNLRPLWIRDNLLKSDNIPENFVDLWNQLCKITGNELKMR